MFKKIVAKLSGTNENNEILIKNFTYSFLISILSTLVGILTLPSYISFFNNAEVLGLWYAFLSILTWMIDLDFGIGNGLKNHLTKAISLNNTKEIRGYISSAYFSVGVFVIFASALITIFSNKINFNSLLNINKDIVSPEALSEAITIILFGVLTQFLLKLINAILNAMQKPQINNLINLITNILLVIFLNVYPTGSNDDNIVNVAHFRNIATIVPLIATTIFVFSRNLKHAIPRIKYFSCNFAKHVFSLGGQFFFVQLFYIIIMSTNEVLITKFAGNIYNVDYQAYYKVFTFLSNVFFLISIPLWSVVTKAVAEKDTKWIKSSYKKLLILSAVVCLFELLIIPTTKPLMILWLGKDAIPQTDMITSFTFAVLGCLLIITSVFSAFACGMSKLKTQAICYFIGAVIKVPLSYVLVKLTNSWLGVVIANDLCLGFYCIVQFLVFKKELANNIFVSGEQNEKTH